MTDRVPDNAGPDLPAERDDETREDEVQPLDEPRQILKTLRHIIELEGRRVGVQEDRNRIAMHALEVSDSADQRQYNFHLESLAAEERQKEKSRSLARLVITIGGGSVLALTALVIGMAFFGDEAQSRIALSMVKEVAKALGGAGFIFLVAAAIRRLMQ